MKNIFEQAGFKNVADKEITNIMQSGTIDNYWNMMTEVGAPIVAALGKADEATRQKIKTQVYDLVREKHGETNVRIGGSALVINGEK